MPKPYDKRAWRRLSQHKLQQQPLCEACLRAGRIEPAVHVDHIIDLNDGGDLLPALEGLMSLCLSCHSLKTATGNAFKGCDINGMPLDPAHPWFRP
jgi:5-methylcytosine-specific restriction endonuclease McrA